MFIITLRGTSWCSTILPPQADHRNVWLCYSHIRWALLDYLDYEKFGPNIFGLNSYVKKSSPKKSGQPHFSAAMLLNKRSVVKIKNKYQIDDLFPTGVYLKVAIQILTGWSLGQKLGLFGVKVAAVMFIWQNNNVTTYICTWFMCSRHVTNDTNSKVRIRKPSHSTQRYHISVDFAQWILPLK